MISGSVAVEGGAARNFPGGGSEFLRPLPPASSYMRSIPTLPHPGQEPEVPSTPPAYLQVPGSYARLFPRFYPYHYHQLPQPPSPLPPPPSHTQTQLQESLLQQSQLHTQRELQREQENFQRRLQREQESLLQRDREVLQLQRERDAATAAQQQAVAGSPLQPPVDPHPPLSPPSRPPPRGKEGSLKHRLLARGRTTMGRFTRGALIQLGGGQVKRVENMTTEDFLKSAERSPELKIVDSTVVRLLRRTATDSVTLTLSYNGNTAQVDMESAVEHPFFVYGQGWASCSPERTMQCYGLQVNRLQVGDVCVSLVPREPVTHHPPNLPPPAHHHGSQTIVTTATTTAMTVRPTEAPQRYPENLSLREDARKRRSSAPDTVGDDLMKRPRTLAHH